MQLFQLGIWWSLWNKYVVKTTKFRAALHLYTMKNMNTSKPDPKSSQVIELLRQIERLNFMIAEHDRANADDVLIVEQYELLRADFLAELSAVLSDYGIEAELKIV